MTLPKIPNRSMDLSSDFSYLPWLFKNALYNNVKSCQFVELLLFDPSYSMYKFVPIESKGNWMPATGPLQIWFLNSWSYRTIYIIQSRDINERKLLPTLRIMWTGNTVLFSREQLEFYSQPNRAQPGPKQGLNRAQPRLNAWFTPCIPRVCSLPFSVHAKTLYYANDRGNIFRFVDTKPGARFQLISSAWTIPVSLQQWSTSKTCNVFWSWSVKKICVLIKVWRKTPQLPIDGLTASAGSL